MDRSRAEHHTKGRVSQVLVCHTRHANGIGLECRAFLSESNQSNPVLPVSHSYSVYISETELRPASTNLDQQAPTLINRLEALI